jgi:hypothetical protein
VFYRQKPISKWHDKFYSTLIPNLIEIYSVDSETRLIIDSFASVPIKQRLRVLLEKLIVTQSRYLPLFMEPEGSLPCS